MQAYDAIVADWPAPFSSLKLPTRLGETYVIASGPEDAPALFLLPSLMASATLWRPNVAALSRTFRVHAVDTPGQVGRSTLQRPIAGRQDMADWLNDLMDAVGAPTAALVGASFGGFLAMNQAVLAPDRVERIAMISPAATFAPFSAGFYWTMMVKGPLMRLWRKLWRAPAREMPGGLPLDDTPGGWGALMRLTMAHSARPSLANPIVFGPDDLARVRAPALLLIGERERLYDPAATLERARACVPGLQGAVIPGAGHLAALERPDDVNARLLAFLTAR
jgi:pimeloyl-ACP methyl ester carboxylesterase